MSDVQRLVESYLSEASTKPAREMLQDFPLEQYRAMEKGDLDAEDEVWDYVETGGQFSIPERYLWKAVQRYKDAGKDLEMLKYRIRQVEQYDLSELGQHPYVTMAWGKATMQGLSPKDLMSMAETAWEAESYDEFTSQASY